MRLFVCSLLTPDAQAFYAAHIGALVDAHADVLRPVPPRSAHVTYAFVAQADDAAGGPIAEAMARACARHRAVDVAIGAPFVLRAGAEPRLVCAPLVDADGALAALARDAAAEVARVLPPGAVKPARSLHVTLARFRNRAPRSAARPVSDALRHGALALERRERIARVQTVTSTLTPAGPVYEVQAEAALLEKEG